MKYNYDIAFIIPAYNVGAFIGEAIESILIQTNVNSQIIIVNDGSTDNTIDVCTEYLRKYSNINLINKRNEGVSIARNIGLEHVDAEYICFMDGDDIYLEDFAYNFLTICRKNNLDIIRGQYTYFGDGIKGYPIPSKTISAGVPMIGRDFLHRSLFERVNEVVTVLGFYRTDYLRSINVKYPPGVTYTEDQIVHLKTLLNKNCRIMDIECCFYGYRVRSGSACNSGFSIKKVYDIVNITKLEIALISDFPDCREDILRFASGTASQVFAFYKIGNNSERKETLTILYQLDLLDLIRYSYVHNHRIKFAIAKWMPSILNLIYK